MFVEGVGDSRRQGNANITQESTLDVSHTALKRNADNSSSIEAAPIRSRAKRSSAALDPSYPHSLYSVVSSSAEASVDYLKLLYPHPRDNDCVMEELSHSYRVHGRLYPCSVSDVVRVFFEAFPRDQMSELCLRNAGERGLRNMESSIYNLVMYLSYGEGLLPGESAFQRRVNDAIEEGRQTYVRCAWEITWSAGEALVTLTNLLGTTNPPKPQGSCYFPTYCAGCTPQMLAAVWDRNGEVESLKGTFLHKQAELYMQAMAEWQFRRGRRYANLSMLMRDEELMSRVRNVCHPVNVMRSLAAHTKPSLWDHPTAQAFFRTQLKIVWSPEYLRLEAWLKEHPSLSPYRAEWSIYHDTWLVAGQIDSLWFDTQDDFAIVMADWKRSKQWLTSDVDRQSEQAFQRRTGLDHCIHAPDAPGPCRQLYDCAYNHYLVQQRLYAYIVSERYGIIVKKILLVQCHPNIGDTIDAYHEEDVPVDSDGSFSLEILNAFEAGWKKLGS